MIKDNNEEGRRLSKWEGQERKSQKGELGGTERKGRGGETGNCRSHYEEN